MSKNVIISRLDPLGSNNDGCSKISTHAATEPKRNTEIMPTFVWTVTSARSQKPKEISTEGEEISMSNFCFALAPFFHSVETTHITAKEEPPCNVAFITVIAFYLPCTDKSATPRPSQRRPSPVPHNVFEEVRESDLIERVLSKGHPTVTTAMQEFGVKEECEFTKEKDEVDYYLKGITEGGVGLKAAHRQGGSHARKLENLEEHVPKASSCLEDRTRDKEADIVDSESELAAMKVLQDLIKGDVTAVRDKLRVVADKTNSTLRGVQVANAPNRGMTFLNLDTPLSYSKYFKKTSLHFIVLHHAS